MLNVHHTVASYRSARSKLYHSKKIGFVPTMGSLHEGHFSLVEQARQECDIVGISIFVNPKQFGPNEDFDAYPRTVESDLEKCRAHQVDFAFVPSANEMYPTGFSTGITVDFDNTREGKSRPGFFNGVSTVCCKLFNIIQPDKVFFGQKDAVQCMVIRKFTSDLNMPIEVVVCPTVREADGLAMSSRNQYLDARERGIAPVLSRALFTAENLYLGGEMRSEVLIDAVKDVLSEESDVHCDYISIDDSDTGLPVDVIQDNGAVLSGALWLGKTRLIDNIILKN
eukprot:TRINITY_DN5169_c0_g1_i1.p1 TRINITY_DN5169_c0_g1~~TRINITY_DN5169_c0_g1_i1.p1  ORF type:complete len:282 (+),score=40.21 TRINITY_DN5169_c0_g1_i1:26-871(+)